jgi:lipopolysaccharide biosynthesis regulator YciM
MVWLLLPVVFAAGWLVANYTADRQAENRINQLEEAVADRNEQIAALRKRYDDMVAFLAAVDEEAERQARRRGGRWTRDRL